MISSDKINLITIVLIVLAMVGVVILLGFPMETTESVSVGIVTYGDHHSVSYQTEDFNSEPGTSYVQITLSDEGIFTNSSNVSISGNTVTILGGGTYLLSGDISHGTILVDSTDDAVVHLVCEGVSVTSKDYSALYVKQAEKVVLSLVEGTENFFSDGSSYDSVNYGGDEISAAIYSKDDLTINGSGSLNVRGNYQDGIKCNDTLKIMEGSIAVEAVDEGINANDALICREVSLELSTGGDSLKCDYEDDDKGFIVFEGTTIRLESQEDGISASSSIYMSLGSYELTAKDDGIHAEDTLILAPDSLKILSCYEGLEGAYVTINGGDIYIKSSDDAINATGYHSNGGMGRFMGMNGGTISAESVYLTINGGTLVIESSGDGIDSNGSAIINGGNIRVFGPENNGNSSLDFEYGMAINGGTILAAGSSGMAELPSDSSDQASIVFYFSETYPANSTISICDNQGTILVTDRSTKKFNWVCFSDPSIVSGETYSILIDGTVVESVEVSGTVTSSGSQRGMRRK